MSLKVHEKKVIAFAERVWVCNLNLILVMNEKQLFCMYRGNFDHASMFGGSNL
jgi:hypothetical protein